MFASLTLKPGVDVEATPVALRAGYAELSLGRFRSGFAEKIGGWIKFYAFAVGGVPKALHAWQDFNDVQYLAVGTTSELDVISDGQNTVITPQTLTSEFEPNFSTTISTDDVTVTDANIANVTTYDTIDFRTPISVGGLILSGAYPISLILGTTNYQIVAASDAATTRGTLAITNISQAATGVVTYTGSDNIANGDLVYIYGVTGMTQVNNRLFTVANLNAGANTFELSGVNTTAYTAYSADGTVSAASVPFFTTTAGSASVTVTFQDHGLSAGNSFVLPISTALQSSVVTITIATPGVVTWFSGSHGMTGNEPIVFTTTGALPTGLTAGTTYYVLAAGITATTFRVAATPGGTAIDTTGAQSGIHTGTVGDLDVQGNYTVLSVTDVDNFVISASSAAIATSVVPMNGGEAELVYYIGLGPTTTTGTAYSFSTYSSGPYSGTGAGGGSSQEGDPITAIDWTLDNWGETLLACPANGGIYEWGPTSGFQTAKIIGTAPLFNGGIFVANPYQAVVAWASTVEKDVGIDQDPLTYRISDLNDYTYWIPNTTNPNTGIASQAYENRIPRGSTIRAGLATAQQILLWTDLGVWRLSYMGLPAIWTQDQIGDNCGAAARHAVAAMGGVVYWMGRRNFHAIAGGAPATIPCTVWDQVFQNLDEDNITNCWCQTVTGFNEVWFFYPSADSADGQCDSYAKVNVIDGAWDAGPLPRSAGIDQSVLGDPILATPTGIIYQHEQGYDADGQPLTPSLTTGFFYLSEGQDFVFTDQFYPDFKFATYDGETTSATVQVTFSVKDFPGDTPRTYGPYTMTTSTQKLDVRFRGRMFQISLTSTDQGSFWRLGKPYFRIAASGRR